MHIHAGLGMWCGGFNKLFQWCLNLIWLGNGEKNKKVKTWSLREIFLDTIYSIELKLYVTMNNPLKWSLGFCAYLCFRVCEDYSHS